MKKTVQNGKNATTKRSSVGALTPLTKEQQELVTRNIPFAMNMGKKYAGLGRFKGVPMEDLQQEACYGLCIAAQKYRATPLPSPVKGEGVDTSASFQTYAYTWCLKYIMMAINETAPLISPEGEDIEDVDTLDELSTGLIDDDDEQAVAEERVLKVEALLTVLNAQEKEVVCMIYGIGCEVHGFMDIALKMKLQTARVHHIYEKARTKMEFQTHPYPPSKGGGRYH